MKIFTAAFSKIFKSGNQQELDKIKPLIEAINKNEHQFKNLKEILAPINCKLNLIPYNEINGPYRRPSDTVIKLFISSLKNASFPVTVRWSKGQDIDAGCGQLATVSEHNK